MWFFLIFVGVPLVEIGLFVSIGGQIGLWPTLGFILLTAVIGSSLVRKQGLQELAKLQGRASQPNANPNDALAHGVMILCAGAFLITPGFFTDTLGFLLLIPTVRGLVFSFVKDAMLAKVLNASRWSASYGGQFDPRAPKEQDHEHAGVYDYDELEKARRSQE